MGLQPLFLISGLLCLMVAMACDDVLYELQTVAVFAALGFFIVAATATGQ